MNKKQKSILGIAAILFFCLTVYPAWLLEENSGGSGSNAYRKVENVGRHIIFLPPEVSPAKYKSFPRHTYINKERLFIEWAAILIPAALLFVVAKD